MLIPFGVFSAAGAGGGASAGAYELISTAYGTGSSGVITFSSLPAGYKHLQIRAALKNTSSSTDVYIRFNSDTGSNYSQHLLYGNGSSVGSGAAANTTSMYLDNSMSSSSTANATSGVVVDILDAFSTTKNKTTRSLHGKTDGSSINLESGNWRSTSAITSISITCGSANFAAVSRISLYGIKG